VSKDLEQLVATLADTLKSGEHVLIMSNGGFGGIHKKLLERLAKK
jgi:UDP-N-acetylmuramate: L-alanyl-gamma-D-glutamyl-meso-diaminopimelate ligase